MPFTFLHSHLYILCKSSNLYFNIIMNYVKSVVDMFYLQMIFWLLSKYYSAIFLGYYSAIVVAVNLHRVYLEPYQALWQSSLSKSFQLLLLKRRWNMAEEVCNWTRCDPNLWGMICLCFSWCKELGKLDFLPQNKKVFLVFKERKFLLAQLR
jgi:hypothetical protein